jgi:very-short-patch-repair endonuclease
MQYDKLNDNDKKNILHKLYEKENKSFKSIADELGTYANKVRRDAIKFKINIRDKSDAQKNALKTGKHSHPTKGKVRPDNTKHKIGLAVLKSWETLSESELQSRKQKAKDNWDNLSEDEKSNMQQKANEAVRVASKVGSKLEKFIFETLLKDGYKVIFHQEQALLNTKLQIDLFIPSMNVAIEIDGPSHFLPVWGDDALQKNISYDNKKEGLIIGKGLKLIRIKQLRDFSKTRSQLLYANLKNILDQIQNNTTNDTKFTIEDNDE